MDRCIVRLYDVRLEARDDAAAFAMADAALSGCDGLRGTRRGGVDSAGLAPGTRKFLESLGNYWTGLTVFVEHPEGRWTTHGGAIGTRAGGRSQELLR